MSPFLDDIAEDDDVWDLPANFDRSEAKLFSPLQVGDITLKHRVVHAALDRARAPRGVLTPLAVNYYSQRIEPGSLVITGANNVTQDSGFEFSTSLVTDEQVESLSHVVDAVHKKNGFIFAQLWHTGRAQSPALVKLKYNLYKEPISAPREDGTFHPISSSDIPEIGINVHSGEPYGVPRPLEVKEIHYLTEKFAEAAQRAVKDAGSDGVEILGGNGFLLDQFLHDNINNRSDEYGGSDEKRARFLLEVVDSVSSVLGGYQRIGVRLSPFSNFHGTDGSQPVVQALYVVKELALRGVAYVNIGEPRASRNLEVKANIKRLLAKGITREDISLAPFRNILNEIKPRNPDYQPTKLFGNGGHTSNSSILSVEHDKVDGVTFGRFFIANPDLVERIRLNAPFNPHDRSTFYTHSINGYLTYPTLHETSSGESGDNDHQEFSKEHFPRPHPSKGKGPLKRVGIIGAGVSGLAAARAFQLIGNHEIEIFERKSRAGGVWNNEIGNTTADISFPSHDPSDVDKPLDPPPGELPQIVKSASKFSRPRFVDSPIYPGLVTNIPASVMFGSSLFAPPPVNDNADLDPYLDAQQVVQHVQSVSKKFESLISFRTTVEKVEKQQQRYRFIIRTERDDGTDYWQQEEFDFVIIATGHNSVPRVPDIEGLQNYKGDVTHSITYKDNPNLLTGKRVLIIGNHESAIDITIQGLPKVNRIYVSQKQPHPRLPTVFNKDGIEMVPETVRFSEESIVFSDGNELKDIDLVVFATGYHFSYPFLRSLERRREGSDILGPRYDEPDGQRVPGLYYHIFDIYNKNIAFIGNSILTLSWQAWENSAFLAALVFNGLVQLPSFTEQRKWEENRLTKTGAKFFHLIKPDERSFFFSDLALLAEEYLNGVDGYNDEYLRDWPHSWTEDLIKGARVKREYYEIEE